MARIDRDNNRAGGRAGVIKPVGSFRRQGIRLRLETEAGTGPRNEQIVGVCAAGANARLGGDIKRAAGRTKLPRQTGARRRNDGRKLSGRAERTENTERLTGRKASRRRGVAYEQFAAVSNLAQPDHGSGYLPNGINLNGSGAVARER